MADTIIKKDILSPEVERFLDEGRSLLNWVNMRYSPSIKKAGDTATVQTFPDVTLASGTAGAAIADTDFTVGSTNVTADQVKQRRFTVTDFDESVSNLDLHSKLANRIAQAVQDDMEVYFGTLHTGAITANELDDGDLATATNGGAGNAAIVSTANIYEVLAGLNKVLDDAKASGERAVFVNPAIKSILIQAGLASGTDLGYKTGKEGDIVEIAGLKVFVSNNLPAGFIIAMDHEAVFGVGKYTKVDVRPGPDGFYDNVMVESIYGGAIPTNGSSRIATFEITNA